MLQYEKAWLVEEVKYSTPFPQNNASTHKVLWAGCKLTGNQYSLLRPLNTAQESMNQMSWNEPTLLADIVSFGCYPGNDTHS